MSSIYRPFRSLFRSPRVLSRLQPGQTIRVERVKIRKGKPATRFLGTVFKGVLVFQLLMWALPPAPEKGERTTRRTRHTRDDEDDEPLFIAFPLTTKLQPPEAYSRRSPEWQEFVRISRDPRQQKAIRAGAAKFVVDTARNDLDITRRMGKDISATRYWLDLHYPYYAPPVYERSGILITDDALEWVSMPCDPFVAKKLERILWPQPLAAGFWALGTETMKQAALGVAKYLGFSSEETNSSPTQPIPRIPPPIPSAPSPEMQKALERIRQQATQRPEQVNNPGSIAPSAGAPPTGSSTPGQKGVPLSDGAARGEDKQEATADKQAQAEAVIRGFANSKPMQRFKEAYAQSRKPFRILPPRGSITVTGLVHLESSAVYAVVDILTYYDPKTKSFAPGTTKMSVRVMDRKRKPAPRH